MSFGEKGELCDENSPRYSENDQDNIDFIPFFC